jgi:hypothetical protein
MVMLFVLLLMKWHIGAFIWLSAIASTREVTQVFSSLQLLPRALVLAVLAAMLSMSFDIKRPAFHVALFLNSWLQIWKSY